MYTHRAPEVDWSTTCWDASTAPYMSARRPEVQSHRRPFDTSDLGPNIFPRRFNRIFKRFKDSVKAVSLPAAARPNAMSYRNSNNPNPIKFGDGTGRDRFVIAHNPSLNSRATELVQVVRKSTLNSSHADYHSSEIRNGVQVDAIGVRSRLAVTYAVMIRTYGCVLVQCIPAD